MSSMRALASEAANCIGALIGVWLSDAAEYAAGIGPITWATAAILVALAGYAAFFVGRWAGVVAITLAIIGGVLLPAAAGIALLACAVVLGFIAPYIDFYSSAPAAE
jgi:hypothetical protein